MPKILLNLAIVAAATVTNGATITITKRTEIQVGEQRQLAPPQTPGLVASTRDGGYLVCLWGEVNWTVQRFSESGASLWTHTLPIDNLVETLDCRNGEFLFLAGGGDTPWRLVRSSSDGTYLGEVRLPTYERRNYQYQAVAEVQDGFLVAGSTGYSGLTAGGGPGYAFVHKLSADLQIVWQRRHGDIHGEAAQLAFLFPIASGGYLIGSEEMQEGFPIRRIGPDGTTNWTNQYYGAGGYGLERISIAFKCADGSFLLGASSQTAPGGSCKSAEHFGGSDFWLIKISASGSKVWDRSYGGTGAERLTAMLQTEDGGFLVAGGTSGSGVTGNKATDGDGTWLLKTDSRGVKEAEVLFPTAFTWMTGLLPSLSGYRQVGSVWIADILPLKKVRVEVKGAGKPFNVHVSADLSHWTALLINFSGDLSFEESTDAPMSFYRAADAY